MSLETPIDDGIESPEIDATKEAKRLRRYGYRVKARVANLLAAQHGKKQLREGTSERLRREILQDLEQISHEKKRLASIHPKDLSRVLRETMKQEYLWRHKNKIGEIDYKPVHILNSLPNTPSEVEFVIGFLTTMGVRREAITRIITQRT